ncbi:MAG TPA: hypothetical protein PKN36_02510 [bacterium]|nr:hypothetical protein [bacterium]
MKTLTLYLKQEKIIYSLNGDRGIVEKDNISSLVKDLKSGLLNVIVSKPDIIFRKMELPFTNARKARLVLPHELEDILPESPSNFFYSFEFYRNPERKIYVNIYAIKDVLYNYWKEIADKCGAKLSFFSDTTVFNSLLKRHTVKENHAGIYAVDDYILLNITEKGRLAGSYSYSFAMEETSKAMDMLKTILSSWKSSVFFLGCDRMRKELDEAIRDSEEIRFMQDVERDFVFPCMVKNSIYKLKPLKLRKIAARKKIPVYAVSFLLIFIIASFIAFIPYFKLPERERYRESIINAMKEKFIATCPDVTKIVDPLVQIKEKIAEKTTKLDTISGYPSILKIMADITALFPDGVAIEIEQFTVAADNVSISGRIESLKALEDVKKRAVSEKFSSVAIGAVSYDERNRVSFNMTLGIEKDE